MSHSQSSESVDAKEDNWQRLSPIAVIYFAIKFTVKFIKESLLNLAPAFAITLTSVEDKLFWISIGLGGLVILLIAYAVAYYFNFKFCIHNHEILVNNGVFKKERLTLNFGRVQNVNIATPFYFAPLNLVNCIFDSAGSNRNEISLPGVSSEYANQLREAVFLHKEHSESVDQEVVSVKEEKSASTSEPIWTMSNKEAAKFGLTSNMTLILLAALAPFSEMIAEFYKENIAQTLTGFYHNFTASAALAKGLAGGSMVVVLIIGMLMFSIIGAWLRYHNFELYRDGNKLKRISGLLERHQMSLPTQRIQAVTIKQNWIALKLNRVMVCFEQIASQSANGQKNKKQQFIIPMVLPHQVDQFIQMAFPNFNPDIIQFQPIHSAYIRKTLLVNWGLPIVIVATALYFAFDLPFYWSLLAFIPAGLLTWLSYRRYGIWSNEDYCAIRSGLFGYKYYLFPLYKAQQTQVIESRLQKRIGVCILQVQMAFKRIKLPYVNAAYGKNLVNRLLYRVESAQKSWL